MDDAWLRIRELVEEALQRPTSERRRFLMEQCGDDAELRRTAESQLAALEGGGEFLATDDRSTLDFDKPSPTSQVPDQIGPYRVLSLIAEGGLGAVYLAEQREPVKRRVALKVVRRGFDSKEALARFEQEHHALTLMNHPNIARVFDAGHTPGEGPYFVMEYVPGVSITQYCDQQKLTTRERLELFQQVCYGVQHAHQKAILHRDLKPGNVLTMDIDGRPLAKIIDFGVAKATSQQLTDATLHTQVGQIIGTPEYMAPEQADLSALDIDTRADVYSLGVLLYELLVGALPFEPATLRKAGYAEMQRIICEEEPPRPSTRITSANGSTADLATKRRTELGSLLSELRGDLDWIILKAMEKERARRYSSATGLAEDIERFLRNEPVVARPPSLSYRLSKAARRYRAAVLAGGAVLLALLIGLSWALVERSRAEHEATSAEKAKVHAEKSERKATTERQRADDALQAVLRLSDSKRAHDLVEAANELWPAESKRVDDMEEWLAKAKKLISRLSVHEAALRELEEQAQPVPFPKADLSPSQPGYTSLMQVRSEVEYFESLRRAVQEQRGFAPFPFPPELVDADASDLNEIAWPCVEPDRTLFGKEAYALILGRRAVEKMPTQYQILDTLAWALLANAYFEDAVATSKMAIEHAPELLKNEYQGYADEIEQRAKELRGAAGVARLDERILRLDQLLDSLTSGLSASARFHFPSEELAWQHQALAELLNRLTTLQAETLPLVTERVEFARTIEYRTLTSPEARRAWAEAIASVGDTTACPHYRGLELEPLLGFLPLGRDPQTGLWEFWHLHSGARPQRDARPGSQSAWQVNDDTGLVLVLLPGGTFSMGARPPRMGVVPVETDEGLLITVVTPGTTADRAGLRVNDIIVTLNGQRVPTTLDFIQAKKSIVRGAPLRFEALREGTTVTLEATADEGVGSPNVDANAARNEAPVVEVTLDPFLISKYELTQGQWQRLTGKNPSRNRGASTALSHTLNNPVDTINWFECREVLPRFRLNMPTEAQWEYAARGNTKSVFWSGDAVASLAGVANVSDRYRARYDAPPHQAYDRELDDSAVNVAAVGSYRANPFGLHDVHGNVGEWCLGTCDSYRLPARTGDGLREFTPNPSSRVARGGNYWFVGSYARSAFRGESDPNMRVGFIGVRPVRSVEAVRGRR